LTKAAVGGIVVEGGGEHMNEIKRSPVLIETLIQLEKATNTSDYEIGHIVTKSGSHLYTVEEQEHSVEISADQVRGRIFTPNHPGGNGFSSGDIVSIIESDGLEVRATTPNGKVFSFRQGQNYNIELLDLMEKDGLTSSVKMLLTSDKRARDKFGVGNYSKKQVETEAGEIMREWLKENAHKYGYIYEEGIL